jgi:putative ABC transport system permease protein
MTSDDRYRRLLTAISVLAPVSLRREWVREWDAEMQHALGRPSMRPTTPWVWGRLAGAVVHAVWLRKEEWRIDMVWHDVRFGARMLLRRPAFTLVAALTLALGIGANAAIFSLVYGVLLKPLPLHEPHRLVQIWETNPLRGWTRTSVAPANLLDWQARNHVFEDIAFYFAGRGANTVEPGVFDYNASAEDGAERLKGARVSPNLFPVLGVQPLVGRTFAADESTPGKHLVIVLSHAFWTRRFGQRPDVVGSDFRMNALNYRIVGVMPPRFTFPDPEVDFWAPLAYDPAAFRTQRRPHFLRATARLKPGVTIEQARAEMNTIASALEREYPETNTQMGIGIGEHQSWRVGDVERPLLVFLGAVAFVLLIACANVANLLLARAGGRARELAIRTAVGAGRAQLVRQLLIESAMLASIGGIAGIALAVWLLDVFVSQSAVAIPRLDEVSLDRWVLLFVALVTLLTTVLFGVLPAFQTARIATPARLKDGGRGSTPASARTTRRLLVVSEIALAVALTSGAALMIRSFMRLMHVDPGFDASRSVSMQISLPGARYDTPDKAIGFFEALLTRVRAVPGVTAAGASTVTALRGSGWTGDLFIDGKPNVWGRELRHKEVTPGYFDAMGLPILRGRAFLPADDAVAPLVTVINEALAREYFAGEDPVGRRISFDRPNERTAWRTIIGVVHDEKQDSLADRVHGEVYESHRQKPQTRLMLVARADAGLRPAALAEPIRREVAALDREVAVFDIETLEDVVSKSVSGERFAMMLLSAFAALALVLAAIGVYGVISFSVSRRIPEFGVRMALGATRRDVMRLVLSEGAALVAIGLAVGFVLTLAATRAMSGMLFEVQPHDPQALASSALFLAAVALAASYIPARQATRIDPITALRVE